MCFMRYGACGCMSLPGVKLVSCGKVNCCFRYNPITVKEVVLPSVVIQVAPVDVSLQRLEANGKMLHFQYAIIQSASKC